MSSIWPPVFGRGKEPKRPAKDGLARRCHLTGQIIDSEVWYAKTLQEDGQRKRVYASPEAYWELPEAERAAYRRETLASEGKPRPLEHRTSAHGGPQAPARDNGPTPGADPGPTTGQRPSSAQQAPSSRAGVIHVEALAKTYPDGTEAVKGVSFEVQEGEIFGILGPNGAGKSTLIGMLGTLVKPTGGQAHVGGHDIRRDPEGIKPILGFALQDVGVDELATGREFLELQARLFGIPKADAQARAAELLELVGLTEAADKRIGSYSGGMQRKIDLASALIHEPEIVFLDEPTEGLDPRARQELWAILRDLRTTHGATILLSTHYMEEADNLCDRLAIIDQGEIVARGTPEALKASVGRQSIVLEYDATDRSAHLDTAEQLIAQAGLGQNLQRGEHGLRVYVGDPARATPKLLRLLEEGGAPPDGLHIQKATLDDVYLSTTGRSIQEAEAQEAAPEVVA